MKKKITKHALYFGYKMYPILCDQGESFTLTLKYYFKDRKKRPTRTNYLYAMVCYDQC